MRYLAFASVNLRAGVQELTAPQLPISRIVPIVAHAVAVFGDEHKASHWLSTPLALLGNRAPSELLNSTEGIQRVEEILTRIEHNIFS
jgi:putative toxin-antitoxin system antitoxin component (TIGR02293 family)